MKLAPLITTCWLAIGTLTQLLARAGGAGGHSSGGGGGGGRSFGGGGGGFSHGSYYSGPGGSGGGLGGLFCIIVIIAIVVVIMVLSARAKQARPMGESLPLTPPPLPPDRASLDAFLAANPDFSLAAFQQQVSDAFHLIQAAWSAQSLAGVRRFISDGMYQRFSVQFQMMAQLKQRNQLANIRILLIEPITATRDGEYDVIQVKIVAAMHDSFVCELDHSLDTEGDDSFTEYWSFIRKRDGSRQNANSFQAQTCPSCGAQLPPDMGELCRCAYCQVMVNSGEFDWVLAEITQEGDFDPYGAGSQLAADIADLTREAPDLAVQLIEDKASNAFMQIMAAFATRNPARVRRFVSDDALAAIAALMPPEPIIFNRLYLNHADLIGATRANGRHVLSVGLTASRQRVRITRGGFEPLDPEEIRSGYLLTLERDAGAVPSQGALYQHQCPNCSGAVGDTLDLNCQYCGVPLNSMRNEWIVTHFGGGANAPRGDSSFAS